MAALSIPLDSPVDLETENIIQKDFSFKRKNSLVYKGILSNITSKKGDGVLSTTGKQITTTNTSIIIDGQEIKIPGIEAYITAGGEEEIPQDTIFVRPNNNKFFIVRKPSNTSIIISNGEDSYTYNDISAIDVNGTITSYNKFIIVSYYDTETKVSIYSSDCSLEYSETISEKLGSLSVSSYCLSADDFFIGFDSEDLDKRFVYHYIGYFDMSVHGLGLVSETGLVTGEPFFYSFTKDCDDKRNIFEGSNLDLFVQEVPSISYLDKDENDKRYHVIKRLANGIIQSERFDVTKSNIKYATVASASEGEWIWSAEQTYAGPWTSGYSSIGTTPTAYNWSLSQTSNNLPATGIMNFAPGDYSETGNETLTAIHAYVYAVQILSNGNILPKALPAMRRSAFGTTNSNNYLETYTTWSNATEISFMNIEQPVGMIQEVEDGQQVFPHMRFFSNNTNEKGVYWDYGKGWVRFFYDTIHYINYKSGINGYGTGIFEEPIKIITYDMDGLHVEVTDISRNNQATSYPQIGYSGSTPFTWYATNDSTLAVENKWYLSAVDDGTLSGMDFTRINENDVWLVRCHPVYANQLSANTWMYNHSFNKEVLQSRPFSVKISNNIRKQIYNEIAISLSYNKTLLFTPYSMEDSYTFDENGNILTWSSGKVTYAKISATPPSNGILVSKISDYIFKLGIIGSKNVLTESRNGTISLSRAFIPYIMDSTVNQYIGFDYTMPSDNIQSEEVGLYYYGFAYNAKLSENIISSSYILPEVSISYYCKDDQKNLFDNAVIDNKKGIFRADISKYFYENEFVEEYWTHSLYSTDNTYKTTRYLVSNAIQETLEREYVETSWLGGSDLKIYPIGIFSKIYGENYITPTVDVGENYVSRFWNRNNKTFLVFNETDQVYYGSEIFTIQSGNYYFDGQGIYYLGSYTDYTQNVFAAYAIGMKFLANSSAEAYFYSEWDKNLYLFTASNTLQKSISLADMGNILDSLYSPAEQALYILFDDGKLFIKTQGDSCLIEGVQGTSLQSTIIGSQIVGNGKYEIYNPYMFTTKDPLHIETEWLGNSTTLQRYQYVDVILFSENKESYSFKLSVDSLNGEIVAHNEKNVVVSKDDWKNKLCRVRIVPKEILGNAVKVYIDSDNPISIFSVEVSAAQVSQQPSAARDMRV